MGDRVARSGPATGPMSRCWFPACSTSRRGVPTTGGRLVIQDDRFVHLPPAPDGRHELLSRWRGVRPPHAVRAPGTVRRVDLRRAWRTTSSPSGRCVGAGRSAPGASRRCCLRHDRRRARTDADVRAAQTRYSLAHVQTRRTSVVLEKHGVRYDADWQGWLTQQMERVVGADRTACRSGVTQWTSAPQDRRYPNGQRRVNLAYSGCEGRRVTLSSVAGREGIPDVRSYAVFVYADDPISQAGLEHLCRAPGDPRRRVRADRRRQRGGRRLRGDRRRHHPHDHRHPTRRLPACNGRGGAPRRGGHARGERGRHARHAAAARRVTGGLVQVVRPRRRGEASVPTDSSASCSAPSGACGAARGAGVPAALSAATGGAAPARRRAGPPGDRLDAYYSERTVKGVIHEITTRLQLRNRSHAVAFALRNDLI